MLTLPASVRMFVARGATDLRRSFDRLSAQVQEVLWSARQRRVAPLGRSSITLRARLAA
jgi:hypothetical protein